MNVFGLSITRQKAAVSIADTGLQSLRSSTPGGWWPLVREAFTGAWQRNITVDLADVMTAGPVWACVTLIASDIAKTEPRVMVDDNGIWTPKDNPAYSPVLRKPNHYQNRITFFLSWLISKLTRGNTYVLKRRDARGVVNAMYVLDPTKVRVLVADNGDVYYQLSQDNLSNIPETSVTVPAREIIHDLMMPLYHPLVGIAPIHACGLAAMRGLKIQRNSATFFDNQSTPSGVLVAPGPISEETAKRLEEHWNANYAGPENAGKIAALGDGLKFEPMTTNARDSQLTEQLKDAAIEVCNAYHVPPYMVGYGPPPNYNNIEALNAQYYAQCLQILIEQIELCLDEGLQLPSDVGIEFDLENLIRMDAATRMDVITKGIRGGVYTPNEGRKKVGGKPLSGGDTVYLQEQDHSLDWLSRRDALDPTNPASTIANEPVAAPAAEKVVNIDAARLRTQLHLKLFAAERERQLDKARDLRRKAS